MVETPKSGLTRGPFLRIRVDINITKPLMRRKMTHIEDVYKGWVFFKYERLPIFCYHCGILVHHDRECQKFKKGCLSSEEDDFQYGPWLRALAPKFGQKKNSCSKSKTREEDDDEVHVSVEDKGEDELDQPRHQLTAPPPSPRLVRKSNEMTTRHLMEDPAKKSLERENSNSFISS